jgi:16S rRNA (cytosine967-C5)-methyltransferase
VPQVVAALPVATRPAPGLPEGLVLERPFDVHGSELWRAGAIMPQSRGSMAAARALAPRPGARVLDLCAAPGGKTTQLAALLGCAGEVVAVERRARRAAALKETCARMRAGCARVEVADASLPRHGERFDFVLADPPCSGLGTLQSRPDLRWRTDPGAIAELAALQQQILSAAGAATRPGGALVYSVCTISRAESGDVTDRFLAANPEFREQSRLQLRPDRDGTDGFFIARLVRDR